MAQLTDALQARPCSHCSTFYIPRMRKQQYCSQPCRIKGGLAKQKAGAQLDGTEKLCSQGCGRPISRRGMCSNHAVKAWRAEKRFTIICGHCGEAVPVAERHFKFCSTRCSAMFKNTGMTAAEHRARRQQLAIRMPRPRKVTSKVTTIIRGGRFWAGTCRVCDRPFVSRHSDITCSDLCTTAHKQARRHASEQRRRARERNAYIEDVYRTVVFKRDRYKCHLCGKRLNMKTVAPHPLAPTLDHVIPLARGGTHEYANVRAAHFACNSAKSDGGGGEQLMLIG